MPGMKPTPAPIRFWRKVDRSAGPDACWLWTGGRKPRGYGNFCLARATNTFVLTHRYAYELTHGPIPAGLVVRHRCDNPPCCNPDHLILGTHQQNTQDAIERGRWTPGAFVVTDALRERISRARAALTDAQAREAMALRGTASAPVVAARYGVKPGVIYGLWEGRSYRRLFEP